MSWLLPVRDGRRWLGDAVQSALLDSGPTDELIVIDDGSTDNPTAVLPVDRRIRLLRQSAQGIVAALEHGRAVATGRYLARIDADDLVLPGRLDAQVAALDADPTLGAVGGRARYASADGHTGEGMQRYIRRINEITDIRSEILVESPMFHPATTLRAEAVTAVGGYQHGPFPEDYDLFLRLSAAGWGLANLPIEVLEWRDHAIRLTRTDARYDRTSFLPLKQRYIRDVLLTTPSRVVLWGAGKAGRPWTPWLLEQGHTVVAVLDLDPRLRSRHGVPVLRPEALPTLAVERCFVAVGSHGARAEIRERMQILRPEWVEGQDWWALA